MKLALIGQAVSEMIFEQYGSIHVYCPGVGADLPLGSIFFQNRKSCPFAHFHKVFPFK